METPPYMPPQKKNNTNVIVWCVIGGVFACCILPIGLIFGGGAFLFGKVSGFTGCIFAYQDMQRGILKYAAEHKGTLPKAETWQDDVREDYRQSMQPPDKMGPFKEMPADGDWGCKDGNGGSTGMAFNTELSGKKLSDIKDQVATIMIFETEHPAKNLHEVYKPRDFASSPKVMGKNRGWFETPVSGQPIMTNKNGQRVPINTGPNSGGSGINIQTKDDSTSVQIK